MLNIKKFFSGKRLAVIIAGALILALLIVISATGIADKITECNLCHGTGIVGEDICKLCDGEGSGFGSIWALLPPIIAIVLALITKEVFSSLFIGILSGAIIAKKFEFAPTVDTLVNDGLISAVSGTAGIFVFLIILGIMVALVNKAGGSAAFGEWAKAHIKTRVGALLCTFFLGVLIFIDDYFNCLTVGSVMRPVTDKHKVSRAKLAWIIDSTAAPICMIAPISSWAAAVSKYVEDGQGIKLFVAAIPFNFYSLLTIVFVIALVLMKFDFGPMRKFEQNALLNGDLFSGEKVKSEPIIVNPRAKVCDLLIPVIALIISCFMALLYVGGFFCPAYGIDSNVGNFIAAIGDTDATIALPWGGILALIFTMIYFGIRKVVTPKEAMEAIPKGFIAMVPAILILTFATAIKNITGNLGAAFYVGNLMSSASSSLYNFLPAIIFLVACILAFATGTSWGTFGILIPIIMAMYPGATVENSQMVLGVSACLAGAVCGDHCSPISDTTIMSSAGAECVHLNHVSTQLPYAVYVAVISFVCFIIAGFVPIWYVALPIAIVIMVASMFVTKIVTKKFYAKKESAI